MGTSTALSSSHTQDQEVVIRENKSNYAQDLNHTPSLPRAASHSGLPLLAVLERYAAGTAAIIGKILRGTTVVGFWWVGTGNDRVSLFCSQPLVRLVCWLWHPRRLA